MENKKYIIVIKCSDINKIKFRFSKHFYVSNAIQLICILCLLKSIFYDATHYYVFYLFVHSIAFIIIASVFVCSNIKVVNDLKKQKEIILKK